MGLSEICTHVCLVVFCCVSMETDLTHILHHYAMGKCDLLSRWQWINSEKMDNTLYESTKTNSIIKPKHTPFWPQSYMQYMGPGLVLGMRPANERWRYFVTTSLTGWAQTQNQAWGLCIISWLISLRTITRIFALHPITIKLVTWFISHFRARSWNDVMFSMFPIFLWDKLHITVFFSLLQANPLMLVYYQSLNTWSMVHFIRGYRGLSVTAKGPDGSLTST